MTFEVAASTSEISTIHATLLPLNHVLIFGGSEHDGARNPADRDNTRLFNLCGPGSMNRLRERTRRRTSPPSRFARAGVSGSPHGERPVTPDGLAGDGDGRLQADTTHWRSMVELISLDVPARTTSTAWTFRLGAHWSRTSKLATQPRRHPASGGRGTKGRSGRSRRERHSASRLGGTR